MNDQQPGRTPPWAMGIWTNPSRPQAQPVRIGDAERDAALDKLSTHFAEGRLNREELDERTEAAMGARFDSDLEPLFRDLPSPTVQQTVARRPRAQTPAGVPAAVMLLVPLLVLAVVASILLHGPVLVAPVIWILVLSGFGRRHRYR